MPCWVPFGCFPRCCLLREVPRDVIMKPMEKLSLTHRAGPSWASINHDGTWKLLHYAAARFFAPLLVSAQVDRNHSVTVVHVTSDVPVAIAGTS